MLKTYLLKALTKRIPKKNALLLLRRIRTKPNGCWEYLGSHNSAGWPVFTIGKKGEKQRNFMAHRLLYEAVSGQILPRGAICVSACKCIRPEHQRVMTKAQHINTLDKTNVRSPLLNWDAVHRIRRMPADTNWAQVARDLGVAHSTVRQICKNQTWQEHECLYQSTSNDGLSR